MFMIVIFYSGDLSNVSDCFVGVFLSRVVWVVVGGLGAVSLLL